jgi:hypothetical protein
MENPKTRLMLEVGINEITLKMDLEDTLCGLSVRQEWRGLPEIPPFVTLRKRQRLASHSMTDKANMAGAGF